MNAFASKFKFVNFSMLYFPLTDYNEIGTEASLGETDSHLTDIFK